MGRGVIGGSAFRSGPEAGLCWGARREKRLARWEPQSGEEELRGAGMVNEGRVWCGGCKERKRPGEVEQRKESCATAYVRRLSIVAPPARPH